MKKPSEQLSTLGTPPENIFKSWAAWYMELVKQYADIHKLDLLAAKRYVPAEVAKLWWQQGYSILGTLREAFYTPIKLKKENMKQMLQAVFNENAKVTITPNKEMRVVNLLVEVQSTGQSESKLLTLDDIDNMPDDTSLEEIMNAGQSKAEEAGEDEISTEEASEIPPLEEDK